MARIDTAGFYYKPDSEWAENGFYWHHKAGLVPVEPEPNPLEDPCDNCPSWYTCTDWICNPPTPGPWWGSGPIDPNPPRKPNDPRKKVIQEEEEPEEWETTCIIERPRWNWWVATGNWFLTWADMQSWVWYYFNPQCYNEVVFEWRPNELSNNNYLRYWFYNSDWTATLQEATAILWNVQSTSNRDKFRVTLKNNWDFRVERQRWYDSGQAYEWELYESWNVNSRWRWNPSWDIMAMPPWMIMWVMWWATITKLTMEELVEVWRDVPWGIYWDYNDTDYYWRVGMSDWSTKSSPTMLWYEDWYSSQTISYNNWILSVGQYGILSYTSPLLYPEACDDWKKDWVLIDIVLTTDTEFRTTITGTWDWCYVGEEWRLDFRNQYIELRTSELTIRYDGSYLDKKIHIIVELYKENDYRALQRFAMYYEDQWSWVMITDSSSYATNYDSCKEWDWCTWMVHPHITISSSSQNSVNVEYLRISSRQDETAMLFSWNNWTITHNITEWTIILHHYASGDTLTIADKNVWATAYVWQPWSSAVDTYWKYYQWWNNYWFATTWSVLTDNQQFDASNYSWDNPINRNQFVIWFSNWDSPTNNDLWWAITNTDISKKWPCPDGFHIPTKAEMDTLLNLYQRITWTWSSWWYVYLYDRLLFPYSWYRRYQNSNTQAQWQSYNWTNYRTATRGQDLYYWSSWRYYNSSWTWAWYVIRPFKNTN